MVYLLMLLTLASWTCLALVYRFAENAKPNRFVMGAAMGLTAMVADLIVGLANGVGPGDFSRDQVLIGAVLGLMTVVGIPIFMAAVRRGDLSVSWTVMTLSFAMASLLGIIIHREPVNGQGAVGLGFAALAVGLLGLDAARRHRGEGPNKPGKGWGLFMTLSFLLNSASLYCYKLSNSCCGGQTSLKPSIVFLLVTYTVYGVVSLVPAAMKAGGAGPLRSGVTMGILGGLALFSGGIFSVLSLSAKVPSYIFFPATTGGSNVLVVALAVLLFRERPTRLGWGGMAVGLAALVLLSLAA